jgi:hypothetical protein
MSTANLEPKTLPTPTFKLPVDPLQRKHRLKLRFLNGVHALQVSNFSFCSTLVKIEISIYFRMIFSMQRKILDSEESERQKVETQVQLLMEEKSELENLLGKSSSASSSTNPAQSGVKTILKNELQLVNDKLAQSYAVLKKLNGLKKSHYARMQGLLLKQSRDRSKLHIKLSGELKGWIVPGVDNSELSADTMNALLKKNQPQPQEGDTPSEKEGEEGKEESPSMAAGSEGEGGATEPASEKKSKKLFGAAAAAAAGLQGFSKSYLGFHVCWYCGSHYKRGEASVFACSECGHEFCGRSGQSFDDNTFLPCINQVKCTCHTIQCLFCFTAKTNRSVSSWRHCIECNGFMCSKEHLGAISTCSGCLCGPICKGCRYSHDRDCEFKTSAVWREENEDDDDDMDEGSLGAGANDDSD